MLVFKQLRMFICECSGTFYATCYCMYVCMYVYICVCITFCSVWYCFNDCQVDSHTAFTIRQSGNELQNRLWLKMAAVFGKVEEFDSDKDDWLKYVERVNNFFQGEFDNWK